MRIFVKDNIRSVFADHPFSEENILERLRRTRATLDGLTAADLAADEATELTDQNHVGSTRFVRELAEAVGLRRQHRVLDLGCGLGGSARIMAALYECQVHGIDLSDKRCREADSLTNLVGLSHLVSFECDDFLTMEVPAGLYDILWGQGAWLQVPDKRDFVQRWSGCLAEGGRIAFEHACLARPAKEAPEEKPAPEKALAELESSWQAHLISPQDWLDLFEATGLTVVHQEDHTQIFVDYYTRLAQSTLAGRVPSAESEGWRRARDCADAGIISYLRLVAEKSA